MGERKALLPKLAFTADFAETTKAGPPCSRCSLWLKHGSEHLRIRIFGIVSDSVLGISHFRPLVTSHGLRPYPLVPLEALSKLSNGVPSPTFSQLQAMLAFRLSSAAMSPQKRMLPQCSTSLCRGVLGYFRPIEVFLAHFVKTRKGWGLRIPAVCAKSWSAQLNPTKKGAGLRRERRRDTRPLSTYIVQTAKALSTKNANFSLFLLPPV